MTGQTAEKGFMATSWQTGSNVQAGWDYNSSKIVYRNKLQFNTACNL